MKKLLFSLVIVLGAYFIFVPNNETLAQRQDMGGRGGGGAVTGTFTFNANQFTLIGSTQVNIPPNAPMTSIVMRTDLTLDYSTASKPLLTDSSKKVVAGFIDLVNANHFQTTADNTNTGTLSVILGGTSNLNQSIHSAIGGGNRNLILTTNRFSGISSGYKNEIITSPSVSNPELNHWGNYIGGGSNNMIYGGLGSSILGGEGNLITNGGAVGPQQGSAILGGHNVRLIGGTYTYGFGIDLTIDNDGGESYLGFIVGDANQIHGGAFGSIHNGQINVLWPSQYSSILNGEGNHLKGDYSYILGGNNNILTNGRYSGILGGQSVFVDATNAFAMGRFITNLTPNSFDIGWSEGTKFTIGSNFINSRMPIRLSGSTLGFAQHSAPASGHSNNFIWHLASPSVNDIIKVYSTTFTGGTNNIVLTNTVPGAGSGDVTAAVAFGTDNRLIRSDGTGKGVQASVVDVTDTGDISTSGNISGTDFSAANLLVTSDSTILGNENITGNLIVGGVARFAGDIFVKSLTATNGVTNYGPFIGIGTNNGAIRLAGTNTGFAEHTVFPTGPSNSFVWSIQGAPTVGHALVVHAVNVQAGTNQVVLTNGSVASSTTFNANQFDSSAGDVDIKSGALLTNANLRGTSPYDILQGNTLNVTGLVTIGSAIINTNLNVASNAFVHNLTATNSITVLGTGVNGMDNLVATNWLQVNGPQTNSHQNGIRVKSGGSTTNFYVAGQFYALNQGFTNKLGDAALTNAAAVVIPAHMLTNQYDQVEVNFSGAAQAATLTTNQIVIVYGSQTLLDTGIIGMSNSAWRVQLFINRTGNSNQLCQASVFAGPVANVNYMTNFTLGTLQTNGIDTTLQLQLASRKPGGITNDFVHARYFPGQR